MAEVELKNSALVQQGNLKVLSACLGEKITYLHPTVLDQVSPLFIKICHEK